MTAAGRTAATLSLFVVGLTVAADTARARGAARPGEGWRTSGAAWVRGLRRGPQRLLERVDPARGLVVVQSLSCERKPREVFTHVCGDGIARAADAVLRAVADQVRAQARAGDGPGITCTTNPRPACRVPPTNECEPELTIIFAAPRDDAAVIAIVERDDWQSQPTYRAATNRRIASLLARQADGCR